MAVASIVNLIAYQGQGQLHKRAISGLTVRLVQAPAKLGCIEICTASGAGDSF